MTINFLIQTLNRIKWYTPFLLLFAVQIVAYLIIFFTQQAKLPVTMPGDERYAFSMVLFDSLHQLNAFNFTLKFSLLLYANALSLVLILLVIFKARVVLNVSKLAQERVWVFADSSIAAGINDIVQSNKVVINVIENNTLKNEKNINCQFSLFEKHIHAEDTVVIAHANDAENIALLLKIKSLSKKPNFTLMNINDLDLKQGVDKLSLQNDVNRPSTILVTSHLEYQLREQILKAMPQQTLNITENLLQLNIFSSGKMLHVVLRNLLNRVHYPLKHIRIQINVFYKHGSFPIDQVKDLFCDNICIEYIELPANQDDIPAYRLAAIKERKQWPSHWFFYDDKTELAISNALMVERQLDWLNFPPQSMSVLSNKPVTASLKNAALERISIPTPFAQQLAEQLNHTLALENLAEANHMEYLTSALSRGKKKGSQSTLVDWPDLNENFKEDNRAFVDQQTISLATLNYRHEESASESQFEKKHMEEFARSEHMRWASVKYMQGWAQSEIRDDTKKLNPNIKAWERLNTEKQQENIQYLSDSLYNSGRNFRHQSHLLYTLQTPVIFTSAFEKHIAKYPNAKVIIDVNMLPEDFLKYTKYLIIAVNNEEWDALSSHIVETLKSLNHVSFWYSDGPTLASCKQFLQQNSLAFVEVQSL